MDIRRGTIEIWITSRKGVMSWKQKLLITLRILIVVNCGYEVAVYTTAHVYFADLIVIGLACFVQGILPSLKEVK